MLTKKQYIGGGGGGGGGGDCLKRRSLGQFADLRGGGLGKREGMFLRGG